MSETRPIRALIAEDSTAYAWEAEDELLNLGAEIVGVAQTLEDAKEMLLEHDEIDVILLDGNLKGAVLLHGEHGRELAKQAREKFPKALIISISSEDYDWPETDVAVPKGEYERLGEVIEGYFGERERRSLNES